MFNPYDVSTQRPKCQKIEIPNYKHCNIYNEWCYLYNNNTCMKEIIQFVKHKFINIFEKY